MINNPVKMSKIRQQLEAELAAKAEKKRAKKEAKKAKKEAKKVQSCGIYCVFKRAVRYRPALDFTAFLFA